MKTTLCSCLAAVSLIFTACSGSSSNHNLMAEAGTGPDLGRLEAGDRDGAARTDGTLAKTDLRQGDTTSTDAGPRETGAADATVPVMDATTTPDAPMIQPEAGRDLAPADSISTKLDAAVVTSPDTAVVTSPDSAVVKVDTLPSSGNATVDRLAVAALSCGAQSIRTVPVGWQMVVVGEKGCTMEAPPTWTPIGAGSPTTFVVEDAQTRVTGSSVMAGVDLTNTVTCNPHGVVTWMFAKNTDCVGFKELDWKEKVDNVLGVLIPRGDLVYSCTQGGVPVVGYLMVQIHGTSPWCNMLVEAFWMPETQIEARTCTLTQTLNSIQCPQGGTGCDDSACRRDCIAEGNASGACTSDDSCVCTN